MIWPLRRPFPPESPDRSQEVIAVQQEALRLTVEIRKELEELAALLDDEPGHATKRGR